MPAKSLNVKKNKTMDYEKKYKEMKARVLEIGRGYVKGVDFSKPRQIAEYICPELGESGDEEIRQLLVRFVTYDMGDNYSDDISKEECLAWLEKQGEQKPVGKVDPKAYDPDAINEHKSAAWSEENEQLIDEVAVCLREYAEKVQGGYSKYYVQSLADRVESLRPGNTCKSIEWSEDDELKFTDILALLRGGENCHYNTPDLSDWLKVLKQRCTWKPSEEQLRELENVYSPYTDSWDECVLRKLHEQLKQL